LKHLSFLPLLLLVTACAVQPATPLPAVTLVPPAAETMIPSEASVIEPPAPATPFPEDLIALAEAQFGERLIEYITIPAIDVHAPVAPVGWQTDWVEGDLPGWDSPKAAVGWALNSALPGDAGNIILYGHNNIDSSVFKNLYQLQSGDAITLLTGAGEAAYSVAEVKIFPASNAAADREIFNTWLKPTRAPRLTLISCWPPDNNTHRVIVVAYPVLP
jgi:LPXTG-site transpeptidase (sortase) family protein